MILGGGISGLYIAHELLKRNPDCKLILLEKYKLGGRIFTYKDKNMTVEAGAGRFSKNHKRLIKLLYEFHLDQLIPISSESKFAEGSPYNLKTVLAKIVAFSRIDPLHDLTKLSFLNYARLVVSKEEVQFIEDSFGYYTELVDMNAEAALALLHNLNEEFYILKGGLSQLVDAMVKRIKMCPNVEIRKEEVVSIQQFNNHYIIRTNKREYETPFCICTFPANIVRRLSFFKPIHSLLKYITSSPLCKIYCTFDKPWFKNMPKMTTRSPLRMIIPSKNTVLFYSDDKYANYWNDIYIKQGVYGVNKAIRYYVKDVLDIDIKPIHTKIFYWENGVGYWTVGAKRKELAQQLQEPFPNFYLCGENYSANYQQWIEGALETSESVLQRI
jgi:hypothetical protein